MDKKLNIILNKMKKNLSQSDFCKNFINYFEIQLQLFFWLMVLSFATKITAEFYCFNKRTDKKSYFFY